METCPHCSQAHSTNVLFCPSTGKAISVSRIQAGQIVEGKYKVIRRIASGGMGAIYEVEHLRIGKHFAMKLLLPELAHSDEITRRFEREARAASAIGHPNIIEITDMGTTEDGLQFIVMELLHGQDLGAMLDVQGQLEVERARRLVSQILLALEAAHDAGIIHRDLKPENVFVCISSGGEESVKLLDFGISKIAGTDEAKLRLTSTGLILGTPFYMSPEQAKGAKEIDRRSDLFSAGVILYQTLTGKRPYTADSLNSLIYQILSGQFPRPRELVADLPESLENVVLKAMAIDPSERFQSAREFRQALLGEREVERVVPQSAFQPSPTATPAEGLMPTLPQELGMVTPAHPGAPAQAGRVGVAPARAITEPATPARRSGALPVILAGAVVAAGVGLGLVFLRGRPDRPPKKPAPPVGLPDKESAMSRPARADDGKTSRPTRPGPDAGSSVRIAVSTEPKGARVLLNGKEVSGNPFTVPKDGSKHTLTVEANGHVATKIDFKADQDQRLVVRLEPDASRQGPKGTARRRRRRRARDSARPAPGRKPADPGRKKIKMTTDI